MASFALSYLRYYLLDRIWKVCGVSSTIAADVDALREREAGWLASPNTGCLRFSNSSIGAVFAIMTNPNKD